MAATEVLFQDRLTASQLQAVVGVCNRLKIHPNWLMGVMQFESGLNPRATNPNSGSVGLIQFTRDRAGVSYKTISGKRYELIAIKAMSFEQQIELVYEYLKGYAPKIKSFLDLYLVIFFPVAVGKPDDYVLQTASLSASLIARQNPAFDTNKDGQLKKAEVLDFFRRKYADVFDQLNISGSGVNWFTIILVPVVVFFYTVGTYIFQVNF